MSYLSIDLDQISAAKRRDLPNSLLRAAWSAVLQETRIACVQCGATSGLNAHHVIPREEGGPHAPANLETLCVVCHGRETADEHRR